MFEITSRRTVLKLWVENSGEGGGQVVTNLFGALSSVNVTNSGNLGTSGSSRGVIDVPNEGTGLNELQIEHDETLGGRKEGGPQSFDDGLSSRINNSNKSVHG